MAYIIDTPVVGGQPISTTSTTALHPIGTIVKAKDPIYGEGEFVYLCGLAATAVGTVVTYDQVNSVTKLAVANDRGPVAVSMSANIASQFGWYQISGAAVPVIAGAVAVNKPAYVTATAGAIDDAVVATDKIEGFVFKVLAGAAGQGTAVAQINRPSLNGNG